MNIKDYEIESVEENNKTYVQYNNNFDIESRYPAGSVLTVKGRRDLKGYIDRYEDNKAIVKIFGETYSVPFQVLISFFYIKPKEKTNWYDKLKNRN